MGRNVPTAAPETRTIGDGDSFFLGVAPRMDPAQLEPGMAHAARNKRFNHGVAETRKGIRKLNWLNSADLTYPRIIEHFQEIYGSGEFRDPNGFNWVLIAGRDSSSAIGVWRTRENNRAIPVPLPVGETLPAEVHFTQCFNVVVMFRGEDLAELVMEDLNEGFKAIEEQANTISGEDTENPTDGTDPIPPGVRGIFLQNRLFIPHSRDLIGASDYLNYTKYSPVKSAFRINQGSADQLTAIYKFNETTILAFKEQSIYAVLNVTGDLMSLQQDLITGEYGCKALRSIAAVGNDVWFLADRRGVCSILQTEQNKLQGVDVPKSLDIEPYINRINWRYAAGATSRYINNRYYLAVPLDDAVVVKGELISKAYYVGGPTYTRWGLLVGRRYRWTKTVGTLTNGSEVLTESGDFTAQNTFVTFGGGTANTPVLESLKPIFVGVNNAVLVYDFLNQKWAGYDQSQVIQILDWFRTPIQGQERLGFLSADGYLNLYEEGPYDENLYPEKPADWELTIHSLPVAGDVLQVGGAFWSPTAVTAQNSDTNTAPNLWGVGAGAGDLAIARANFWGLVAGTGGYRVDSATPWTSPNSVATQWSDKVFRFTGANGLFPPVFITEDSPLAVGNDPNAGDGTLSRVSTIEYLAIEDELLTRGYTCQNVKPKQFLRGMANCSTWNPAYVIDAVFDGAEEVFGVVPLRTKDRTKYYKPHDAADYDTTNVNNDFFTAHREDYSIEQRVLESVYLDDSLQPDLHQEAPESFWIYGRGRYVQLRFRNTQGRQEVRGTVIEALPATKRFGVHD